MTGKLKKCPFCKGEAEESIIHNITSGISVIAIVAKCKDCGATMLCEALEGCDIQDLENVYGELVEKWNRRAE